jgi:hypothetical protein
VPETLLALSGLGIPLYSARGLTQTVEEADGQSTFERDINNALVDLSPPVEKKLRSTISAEDVEAPAFNGSPKGMLVTVDWVYEFAYLTSMGTAGATRDVVPGSERTVDDWTYYRPRMSMLITNFSGSRNEYGHMTSWTLELEEP